MKKFRLVLGVLITLFLIFGAAPVTGSQNSQYLNKIDNVITGLSFVGHLDTPDDANDVVVQGDYAYVCDRSSLRVVDVSEPTVPVEVGSYTSLCQDIDLEGYYLYLLSSSALKILNVTTPSSPILVGQIDLDDMFSIDVEGDYAYLLQHNDNPDLTKIFIIDIADATNPTIINNQIMLNYVFEVDAAGDYAYIANFSSGLRIFDISDPYNIYNAGGYPSPGYSIGVTVAGNIAYLSEFDGLRIIDVTNPAVPFLLSYFEILGSYYAWDCAVASGIAYIANSNDGIIMLDVTDPSDPILRDTFNTAGSAMDVVVANDWIYVADSNNGLVILQPTFGINGEVIDYFGSPFIDVTITATGGYSTVTDENGVFSFGDIPSGIYTITPSKKGYSFTPPYRDVTIPPDANVVNFSGEAKLFIPIVVK